MGIGCSEETTTELAYIFRCRSKRLHIIYLRLPIGVNARSKSLWDMVIENFKKKFFLEESVLVLGKEIHSH